MQPNLAPIESALRLAATVILLRDGTQGLEVLLLKRHLLSDVHGGVHVFPGGKVDESDSVQATIRFGDGRGLQTGFGDPALTAAQAAVLYTAALRELLEESSIRVEEARDIHPHSRWITPALSTSTKRFDTWFFVGLLPDGAESRHDDHEAVESIWVSPRNALTLFWNGEISLAPPQIMSLAALSRYKTAQAAFNAARAALPPLVQPEHIGQGDERVIAFPGDPEHSEARVALPGPTRLIYRGTRFEPVDGFDALFA